MSWPKGKPRSSETRAKLSAAMKKRMASPEARAKISSENGLRYDVSGASY